MIPIWNHNRIDGHDSLKMKNSLHIKKKLYRFEGKMTDGKKLFATQIWKVKMAVPRKRISS